MPDPVRPSDEQQLADLIGWAVSNNAAVELIGGGSKRSLGRPVDADQIVDLSALSGITMYEPNELVLTARGGTPLSIIEDEVRSQGQHLAFEPPDLGPSLSETIGANAATIGGIVASGMSGSRRLHAGAVRDHVLGMTVVNGRAEIVKSGGRVVKNVTGYDLPKLLTGSHGTLAAITEVTFKVLPLPEKVRTVLIFGLSDARAQAAMSAGLSSPHGVSGAAHLPQRAAGRSRVGYVKSAATGATALRVEGFAPSVDARCNALKSLLGKFGTIEELHTQNSLVFWREIGGLALIRDPHGHHLWRLSAAPKSGPLVTADILRRRSGHVFYDWGGGLVWLSLDPDTAGPDAGAEIVRRIIRDHGGGHATLVRAPDEIRRNVAVFEAQPDGLAKLSARVKESFDPHGVLGPGRMYEGV